MKWLLLSAAALAVLGGGLLDWANLSEEPLPANVRATLVVVEKSKRLLSLYAGPRLLKRYRVSLGREPVGAKAREGDRRTPEGRYFIDFHKADSAYFRALHLSYPNAADRAAARRQGVSPGGAIMIHGLPNGFGWVGRLHRLVDWTAGCVAVTDSEMAELWRAVPDGTPVDLRP